MSGARVVHAEALLKVDVQTAWNAFTTPEGLAAWFVDRMEGEMVTGGLVRWGWSDMDVEGTLNVVAADAPRRLTLAEHRSGAPADVIEVLFSETPAGTLVRLTQTGFVSADPETEAEGASSGWKMAFELLRRAVEENAGKPRATLLRTRTTGLALTQVVPWLLTRGGRALWLPKDAQGEPVLLTTREALLAWTTTDGLVEAKVFPGGPRETIVALRGHSWSKSRTQLEEHVAAFDAALARVESLAAGKR